jgi:cell division transport system ATP-binding protein
MQKRVSIVRGLIHKPPLMLLDEPFVSLDTDARGWLEHLFQQWHLQRRAVCFASHDADQCRRLAHRIIRLDDGRIVAIESTQLKQEPSRRSA